MLPFVHMGMFKLFEMFNLCNGSENIYVRNWNSST